MYIFPKSRNNYHAIDRVTEGKCDMGLRLKIALLMCAAAAAVYTGTEAYRSLQPARESLIPEEIYASYTARADTAQYFLRNDEGYVAVYQKERDKKPVSVTDIELDCLRGADRAMIEEGLPVSDRWELLQLLEDLGS